mmetsp:Transcript_154287/g.269921  ORF Transcript_154287/g.269921 Transcript_154287/m.269921 type:complete len:179 (-) Transcript_154287:22-558(-)
MGTMSAFFNADPSHPCHVQQPTMGSARLYVPDLHVRRCLCGKGSVQNGGQGVPLTGGLAFRQCKRASKCNEDPHDFIHTTDAVCHTPLPFKHIREELLFLISCPPRQPTILKGSKTQQQSTDRDHHHTQKPSAMEHSHQAASFETQLQPLLYGCCLSATLKLSSRHERTETPPLVSCH